MTEVVVGGIIQNVLAVTTLGRIIIPEFPTAHMGTSPCGAKLQLC